MRIIKLLSLIAIIQLVGFVKAVAQSDEISARSVVKIITSHVETENGKQVKKLNTATAWCWKEPTLVVTALHAVAGADQITVNKNNEKTCNATIVKVLKEADLALLRLDADIALTPLVLEAADPNSTTKYSIWGYPHGVYSIQGDNVMFSRSLETNPSLNSIITGTELKHDLKVQGYPLPEARIFRVSSTIQPGHSGAPIFTLSGKVIGVADGGLRGGAARLNWAMPAAFYVPRLLTSTDEKPKSTSMQVTLYSSSVTVNEDASANEEEAQIEKESTDHQVVNGKEKINRTWTANYATIYKTLDPSDKKQLNDLLSQLKMDMSDTKYDVYEDFATGSTLTIPVGSEFMVENGWYYAHNAAVTLHYYVYPFQAGTYENAIKQISTTSGSILSLFRNEQEWTKVENDEDKWKTDSNKQTAYWEADRTNGTYTVGITAEVKGPNLLVTAVICQNDKLTDIDYVKEYLHYAIAGQVASFENE